VTDAATSPLPPFLRACRGIPGGPSDRVPVWFMRQAGRSLPEYRSIRGSGSILDAIADPELSAEITMQPVRRYDVDAAILYSDIVVPVAAIGFGVDVAPGIGPVVEQPFTRAADLERLRPLDPEADTPYVLETVRILARELPVPLIGFAGAPFTVASYLIEGQPSRTYTRTKALMYGDTNLWHKLMERLSDLAIVSLRSQIENGAVALQIFDSWAGTLSAPDYEKYVLPHSQRVFAEVADLNVPRIHFGVGTGELLGLMAKAGADVVGVDWRVPLDVARTRVPANIALQGNLDPALAFAPWDVVEEATRDVLRRNGGNPAHIFNLGHGVMPETDPTVLERVVELVHNEGRCDGVAS
jgi:uroporphyrinogen decarboxylase